MKWFLMVALTLSGTVVADEMIVVTNDHTVVYTGTMHDLNHSTDPRHGSTVMGNFPKADISLPVVAPTPRTVRRNWTVVAYTDTDSTIHVTCALISLRLVAGEGITLMVDCRD